MNTNSQTTIKENKMKITAFTLMRLGRLICHIGRGMLHRNWNIPSREHPFLCHD